MIEEEKKEDNIQSLTGSVEETVNVPEEKEREPETHEDADYILQMLSYMANEHVSGFPITLIVGGLLISGVLVSRKEFLQDLKQKLRDSMSRLPDESKEFMEKGYFPTFMPEEESGKLRYIEEVRYIHLKNARTFYGNGASIPASEEGVLWRGKLDTINGFWYGSLSAAKRND